MLRLKVRGNLRNCRKVTGNSKNYGVVMMLSIVGLMISLIGSLLVLGLVRSIGPSLSQPR
jgi:hypothetical protein